jgi:hypothetical protein
MLRVISSCPGLICVPALSAVALDNSGEGGWTEGVPYSEM